MSQPTRVEQYDYEGFFIGVSEINGQICGGVHGHPSLDFTAKSWDEVPRKYRQVIDDYLKGLKPDYEGYEDDEDEGEGRGIFGLRLW